MSSETTDGHPAADGADPGLDGLSTSSRPVEELDDEADREELRRRYGMLLQELRVLLPGDQLLVAFLLTAPFATRFEALDEVGRRLYAVALTCGLLSVLAFTVPIAFHRFGDRSARTARLRWGVRATRVGIGLLGASLLAAFSVIVRLVYGPVAAGLLIALVGVALVTSWLVLPQLTRTGARRRR